ncbi:MAG TPA: PhoH family protein, partial [Flavobacteriales bacterium]|nr:PhoH family protein [Flavobacteriales bacterium]
MTERLLEINGINPVVFSGAKNENINFLKQHFPKLKIIFRGNQLKIFGDPEIMDEFEQKFELILQHIQKYDRLDQDTIEQILTTSQREYRDFVNDDEVIVHGIGGVLIKPKTPNQRKIMVSARKNDMIFLVGPAGTGKTFVSVALAVRALKNKEVKRIILTRPAVEAGENLGFLPGDLKEKLDPYLQPLYDALRTMIPHERLESYLEKGTIQIAPLAFMRGRTLDNAFVILDEAQNTTHNQMKMFLTRMGKNAKFIITGDPGQIDLPRKQVSGLKEALGILKPV